MWEYEDIKVIEYSSNVATWCKECPELISKVSLND